MATAMDHNDDEGEKGNDINEQHESEELQQMIDAALLEMNNGNYEQAIKILDTAKQQYPNSRAEELQDLIMKLKLNTSKNRSEGNTSTLRQRKQSDSDTARQSDTASTRVDYTNEQLTLVKKINSCQNYYDVLSVSRNASESEIKKSYKKLALHLHPDKNHAPGAAEAFKTLGNAMNILTDVRKRKEYDLAGGNYISSNGTSSHHKPSSYHQFYHNDRDHHHHRHHEQYSSSEASFHANEDFTAEELFHMFFGNYPPSQGTYRRRPYQPANQRQPQENGQQPSLVFVLLLVMIMLSMFMSFFSTDPVYSLSHSNKFNVRRQTQHLSIPYYVKENFENDYQGSLARLENSVEEDYVYTMKQHCFRERSYREAMMARARSFGSRAQFAQAQGLKMPSCDNLSKIGITRYSLY
ncbi:visceral mesodermal armadillo-repeats isoform X2 [Musca autumnalis]|uniref:visceral mesodermal armadillo-repeats isoform X2 n=1 Tax=Musca autumnalis TaxID=221902 RepID=UPI003CEDC337